MRSKKQLISNIPCELNPFFESILPFEDHKWASHVYRTLVIPYVDDFIRSHLYSDRAIELEDLKVMQSFFSKNKNDMEVLNNDKILQCKNRFQDVEALAWDVENAYFKAIWDNNSKLNPNSFLPSNYKELLLHIVNVQLLIFLRTELKRIERLPGKSREKDDFKLWVERELIIRTCSLSNKNMDLKEQSYFFEPSRLYYFLNGTHRVFILLQLELKHMRKILSSWWDWTLLLSHEKISYHQHISNFLLSSFQFMFDLLFVALLPYRLLRTLVNESSLAFSIWFNDNITFRYPKFAKNNHWLILNFALQSAIYLSLIFASGLPILPLPLAWVPTVFFTAYMPLVALSYLTSIVVCSIGRSLYLHLFKSKNEVHREQVTQKAIKLNSQKIDLIAREGVFLQKPMYERFCAQKSAPSTHPQSPAPQRLNISRKLSKS